MASPRAIARALSRSERAQVKAAIKAGDELGYNRNYTRGLVKFGGEGMTPEARMARARAMGFDTETPAFRGLNRPYDAARAGNYQMFTSSPEDAGDYGSSIVRAYLRRGDGLRVNGGGNNFNSIPTEQLPDAVRDGVSRYTRRSAPEMARTDEIAYAARDAGYPSVTISNVYDNAFGEIPNRPAPETYSKQEIDDLAAALAGFDDGLPSPGGVDLPRNYDPVTTDTVFDASRIRSPFATFDPARANRRDLLAGVVPVAAAGGAGALAMQPQEAEAAPRLPVWAERAADRAAIKASDAFYAASDAKLEAGYAAQRLSPSPTKYYDLADGRAEMSVEPSLFGKKNVSFFMTGDSRGDDARKAVDVFASARSKLLEDANSRPWWEPSSGYSFSALTPRHERIYDRFIGSFNHPDYKAVKTGEGAYELRRKFPLRHEVAAAATIGAPAAVLWPQDAEGGVSSPTLGVPAVPGVPDSVGAAPASALARALAREAPRFNAALDTSLDVASFFDPTGGYATETARALKDLPARVGPAGTVALAPLTGATEALGSIGQLPELGVAGGRAIARALARAPQPRGSQTYRKAK